MLEDKLSSDDIKQDMYDGESLSEKKLSEGYINLLKEYIWNTNKPKFLRKLLALEEPIRTKEEANNSIQPTADALAD